MNQGQPRASPRPKAPQPQCPPHKDARGFTMGRGRAAPAGAPAVQPQAPAPGAQHATGPSAVNLGQQLLSQLQPSANGKTAADSASNINHQLLSQLQHQSQGRPPSGSNIGQHLLSQLQGQSSGSVPVGPDLSAGQQLLMQLQGQGQGQAAGRAPAGRTTSGQGFLQQLQGGLSSAPTELSHQAAGNLSHAQTDPGQALLAQLQRSPAKPQQGLGSAARPMAQPVTQAVLQPNHSTASGAASVSFEQLLRGAAATQQHPPNLLAQPMASTAAQPAHQQPTAGGNAPSFDQMLSTAMAQQHPPVPPPGFTRPPNKINAPLPEASVRGPAQPPGFSLTQQLPSQAQPLPAAAVDAGRVLLQHLQGGGLQGPAPGQLTHALPPTSGQPSALPAHSPRDAEAGRMLLMQLQKSTLADNAQGDAHSATPRQNSLSNSTGAAGNGPQPVPSAPPAPASVLLQAAADLSAGSTPSGDANLPTWASMRCGKLNLLTLISGLCNNPVGNTG